MALADYAAVVVLASDALARHPNHPGLNVALCAARTRDAEYAAAETDCVRAATVASTNPEPRLLLGVVYIQTGRAVEAETVLRTAIDSGADDAHAWYNLGSALLGQGKAVEAADAFEAAVLRDPTLAVAWFQLGNARTDTGADDARDAWCRAAQLDPDQRRFVTACGR